jgi:Alkylmercury lyase
VEADDTQRLRELRQVVYREFVEEGRPPTAAEAARRLQLGIEEVLAGWGRLHDDHVLVLDADRVGVRMAHPFSSRPMGFVVASDEQKWWGGCAWDSFGIMAALGQRVLVATTCMGCGRPLALLADPQAPPPEPYVAHFLVPAARWWDDVVRTCSTIRLACHAGHVEDWAAATGGRGAAAWMVGETASVRAASTSAREASVGAVVDLKTMWRLGKVWYGDRLHDDHRRRTPDEATATFAELGLVGPFWEMGAPR